MQLFQKTQMLKNIITLAGYDFTTSAQRTHTVATIVKLKDWDERPESSQSAQALLKKKVDN